MVDKIDGVFRALIQIVPATEDILAFSLLRRISKNVSFVRKSIHYASRCKRGQPMTLTKRLLDEHHQYQDANALRFALFSVLNPLQLIATHSFLRVLDHYFPSKIDMTQENHLFESALKIVLERAHLTPTPKFMTKGLELHTMLQVISCMH
jgi:hypothetical protein